MSYKGKLQTLTKLSIRHQVCPSETCRAIISEQHCDSNKVKYIYFEHFKHLLISQICSIYIDNKAVVIGNLLEA